MKHSTPPKRTQSLWALALSFTLFSLSLTRCAPKHDPSLQEETSSKEASFSTSGPKTVRIQKPSIKLEGMKPSENDVISTNKLQIKNNQHQANSQTKESQLEEPGEDLLTPQTALLKASVHLPEKMEKIDPSKTFSLLSQKDRTRDSKSYLNRLWNLSDLSIEWNLSQFSFNSPDSSESNRVRLLIEAGFLTAEKSQDIFEKSVRYNPSLYHPNLFAIKIGGGSSNSKKKSPSIATAGWKTN